MFQLWGGPTTRATKDIDLLGQASTSNEDLINIVRQCLTDPIENDGLMFDPNAVTGEATPLPTSVPVALTPAFHSTPTKQAQWRAFLRKARAQGDIPDLAHVAEKIRSFLMPVVYSLVSRERPPQSWSPGGPWENGADLR